MQIGVLNRAESENLHISKIQDDGRPPYRKSKNCDISATIQPIVTKSKFCKNMHIAIVNHAESENLHVQILPKTI